MPCGGEAVASTLYYTHNNTTDVDDDRNDVGIGRSPSDVSSENEVNEVPFPLNSQFASESPEEHGSIPSSIQQLLQIKPRMLSRDEEVAITGISGRYPYVEIRLFFILN